LRRFINQTRQTPLAEQVRVADNFFTRLRGLLFAPPIEKGQGLFIKPCPSIHMFGMQYAIDALFVDKSGAVVGVVENIGPNKVSPYFKSALACLELPAGTISDTGTQLGDLIVETDVEGHAMRAR
jgi:uncharacterized protein